VKNTIELLKKNKNKIEQTCTSVGEIVCIFIKKGELINIEILTATFSVLKINDNDYVGLTVFHLQNEFLSEAYERYFFIHIGEKVFHKISHDILDELVELVEKENLDIAEKFITLAKKGGYDLLRVEIDTQFLKLRKKFLQSNKFSDILLDPKYGLQPMPSANFLIFKINSTIKEFIDNPDLKINPVELNLNNFNNFNNFKVNNNSIVEEESDKILFTCGYQNTDYIKISLSDEEYELTIKRKKFPQISFVNIMNNNRNLGIIKLDNYNPEGIITFFGTTTPGSSGSLIFNKEGKPIAISFGNYRDIEEPGINKEDKNEEAYDVIIEENTKNYKKCKNLNLALSLNHLLLKLYFNNYNNLDLLLQEDYKI